MKQKFAQQLFSNSAPSSPTNYLQRSLHAQALNNPELRMKQSLFPTLENKPTHQKIKVKVLQSFHLKRKLLLLSQGGQCTWTINNQDLKDCKIDEFVPRPGFKGYAVTKTRGLGHKGLYKKIIIAVEIDYAEEMRAFFGRLESVTAKIDGEDLKLLTLTSSKPALGPTLKKFIIRKPKDKGFGKDDIKIKISSDADDIVSSSSSEDFSSQASESEQDLVSVYSTKDDLLNNKVMRLEILVASLVAKMEPKTTVADLERIEVELERVKKWHEQGLISEEEYKLKKRKILGLSNFV